MLECPHCGGLIEIVSVNCGIFRHGAYKSNLQQIDPHAPESVCKDLVARDLIWGCGLPFKSNGQTIEKCGFY